jgi:hypothetical protein
MSDGTGASDGHDGGAGAPGGALALYSQRVGAWICKQLALAGDDELVARFEASGTGDWIEVTVLPQDTPRAVFRRLERCAVRYRGSVTAPTPQTRAEILSLVMGIAAMIEARLEARPGVSLAVALGRTTARRKLVFGRDSLRSLLSPDIVEGEPVVGGWKLADVYPSSHLREPLSAALELVLDFCRDGDQRHMLFLVQRRRDDLHAFAATRSFSVTHLRLSLDDPPYADELRALVAFVLQLRDHEGLEVVFPDVAADVSAGLLPAAPAPAAQPPAGEGSGEELNLAIDADCGQACVFCSIRDIAPAHDGGEKALARIQADLQSNHARGVRAVRVNGYDPLAYSRILDALAFARDLGYRRAEVYSPFTRLADRGFCAEIVAVLPADRRFHVPLYAASAEVHDQVVGRPGAFALVTRAMANLAELAGPAAVRVICVATRLNYAHLPALVSYLRERELFCQIHLPFPSFESRSDRYYRATPRQTEVAAVIAAARAEQRLELEVQGVAPCVVFREMARRRLAASRWLKADRTPAPIPGTEYRSEQIRHRAEQAGHAAFHAAVVPCPHRDACVLRASCPGELQRSYVELHGADEFAPVSLHELLMEELRAAGITG